MEFRHISTDLGLSQKTVQSIYQDRHGFMWIGTQEGLNRYDGREIRIFTNMPEEPLSLSNNVVRAITEDNRGNLWIATSNGLNRYDAATQSFERVTLLTTGGEIVSKLYSLLSLDDGQLLVGTDGNGVFSVDVSSDNYLSTPLKSSAGIEHADIRAIFRDSRNRVWFGTDGEGVWLTDSNLDNPINFLASQTKSISHNRIRTIIEDSKGQIWIGTRGGGLNRFDERTKTFTHYKHDSNNNTSLSNNRVYCIVEDSQRRLWVATDGGINLLDSDTSTFTRIKHHNSQSNGLSHNRVLTLLKSQSGLIWLGTLSGLNIWDPVTAKFVHYRNVSEDKNSLTNNTVYGFAENANGQLYIATFGGGLNYFNAIDNQWQSILKSPNGKHLNLDNRIISLMIDSQQRVWIGSFSSGVKVLSSNHEKLNHFQSIVDDPTSLSANGVTDIIEDSDGDIWIATYAAGLNRLDKQKNTFSHYRYGSASSQLKSDSILQIMEDDEGYIWLATDGGGISRLDKNTNQIVNFLHEESNINSLTGNSTWSIFQDSHGRFWIGTQGKGLNRWEPENRRNLRNVFQRYTVADGLPSSTVNGVLEDEQGFIWISTNKGVSRLNPSTDQFTHFNLALGIHNNELNQGAMLKASNGRLYFGGLNGISAFYPSQIIQNQNKPKVVLTNILSENSPMVFDVPIHSLEEIQFTHKDYLITFEFAALDYSQPEKNQYQYKLEGFDPDWVDSMNFNRATYTNLPAGQYRLKVKGSNNDGLWSDESINLLITINPAPWATWWAFTLYSIMFCGFLIILIRTQAKRIANQDLFKKQVLAKIKSTTESIEAENSDLRKQLKSYKINSGNDMDTGLPNQHFFTEQVLISLAYLQNLSNSNSKTKLFCLIMTIDCDTSSLNNIILKLSEKISDSVTNIHLVARWSDTEMAMLGFADSNSSLKHSIGEVTQAVKNAINELDEPSINYSLGYTLNPLNQMDRYPFKWENVLMLTEHASRIAQQDPDDKSVGLIACHHSLAPATMKSIMSESGVQDLEERFEVIRS